MPYAVALYFDRHTESIIQQIWKALEEKGIPCEYPDLKVRPHITLMCYETLDPDAFEEKLCTFAEVNEIQPVIFAYVGVFPKGIVFLGPTLTRQLIELHTTYHTVFSDFVADSFRLYLPGFWVPHCTLASELTPDQLTKAVDIVQRFKLPNVAQLEQIALIKYPPTEELLVKHLSSCKHPGSVPC